MTLKDLRDTAVKRGMTPEQIEKLLFPYQISIVIEEQRAAGMGRKEILSNVHYLVERKFDFGVAVKFSAFAEEFLKQSEVRTFADYFRQMAKKKGA